MNADHEYYSHNRENLPLPNEMSWSQKPKAFCGSFDAFLESLLICNEFETKRPSEPN